MRAFAIMKPNGSIL